MEEKILIGERLRAKRKELRLSIQALSDRSGVSIGQISQIEQGKVIPTVICLYKISNELGVDLNYFFEPEIDVVVQKEGERKVVVTNEGKNLYELLSPSGAKNHTIDFTKITLKAHSSYEGGSEDVSHEGEECGYVLSGAMVVYIDGEPIKIEAGDSIYYRSTKMHHYENPFDEDCISIWAMSPLFF